MTSTELPGPSLAGRDIGAEAALEVGRALDRFRAATKVPLKELAAALQLAPADLSPSHLRQRGTLLLWRLRREQHVRLAQALDLDLAGLRALRRLSADMVATLTGFPVEPERWEGGLEEALEAAAVGVALWDRHRWPEATSHLHFAWRTLTSNEVAAKEPPVGATLRVGTQLVHQLCYAGEVRAAMRVGQGLLRLGNSLAAPMHEERRAAALAYRAVAVAAHHQGLDTPETVVRLCGRANALLDNGRDDLDDRHYRVGALRDQVKPLLRGCLMTTGAGDACHYREEALAALAQAEALAGGVEPPSEALQEEWLLTRLTGVQSLAILGLGDPAQREWEALLSRDWAARQLDEPIAPLASKAAITRMALLLAARDFDGLAASASAFCEAHRDPSLGDRRRRVERIGKVAAAGDAEGARHALLA